MNTYELQPIGYLKIDATFGDAISPCLYRVTIDGVDYYATRSTTGSISIGPPIPVKQQTSKVESVSKHTYLFSDIIVNGKKHVMGSIQDTISYDDAIELAGFPRNSRPTVTYRSVVEGITGGGEMIPGDRVRVGQRIIIDVAETSNA